MNKKLFIIVFLLLVIFGCGKEVTNNDTKEEEEPIVVKKINELEDYIFFDDYKSFNMDGLDIYKLKPINEVKKIKVPIMFVHGVKDVLIDMQHSVKLFEECNSSPKIVNFFEGGHNSKRDRLIVQKILDFFKTYLNEEKYQI